jgi:hypothetical protein
VFLELKKENSFLKGKVIELESRIFKNQETLEAKRENNIRVYFKNAKNKKTN